MLRIKNSFGGLAALLLFLATTGALASSDAEASCARDVTQELQTPSPALERLLSSIKAEFADSHILRLEARSRDLEGSQLIYAVKLLPPDGRVAWLMFDACTLEPLVDPRHPTRGRGRR